jgi:pimeloyl-ACP methyl ester carboxylesterase
MRHLLHVFWAALVLAAWIFQSSAAAAQDSAQAAARTVNGMQMYYETLGVGAPLVLLHSFFGCGHSWQPLIASLAAHYRLIIPDLRGHGSRRIHLVSSPTASQPVTSSPSPISWASEGSGQWV